MSSVGTPNTWINSEVQFWNHFPRRCAGFVEQQPGENWNFLCWNTKTENDEISENWKNKQEKIIKDATEAYNWAIENGIAKEQARSVLPEGNTVSRLYMNGTLRSWIHYIELRSANGTQKEHMEIAIACADVINKIFPMGENLN